ncbi:MAG: ABC transporter substrate-binding protein [Burkholderiaceae bacterium]
MTRRRTVLQAALAGLATGCASRVLAADPPRLPRLVLAGPPAPVSNALIRIVDTGMLDSLAEKVEFVLWKDPDRLRALALQGGADVLAMPVNVAANLHNRGADIRLLEVSAWGILWIVTRDPKISTLADLRGHELAVPFRGDMPDIIVNLVARRQGIDLRKEVNLRYVASPFDAMQLLLARRVDSALLAEPAASMALLKSAALPLKLVAPTLYRGVDLQQEWGHVFDRPPRIPQAGIAVAGSLRERPDAIARIAQACRDALAGCTSAPLECGEAVARRIDLLDAEAVAEAMRTGTMRSVPATEARPELEFLFSELLRDTPALVGGRMPPDAFYLGASGQS